MRPTTILVFHPSAELYGADRALLELVRGLSRAEFRFVVGLPRPGPLAERLAAAGARVEVGPLATFGRASLRPRGWVAGVRGWRAALVWSRALVRRHAPDVVHTNTLVVLCGARAAELEGVPHLWHLHEILERPRWLARALARRVERSSALVACNSRATAAHWTGLAPGLAPRTRVVVNGVAGFAPRPETAERAAARRALGLAEDAEWVVLVGRINAWKGQGLALEALARIAGRRPRARLAFVGDAPPGQARFAADLERRIDELGLRERTARLPFREEVELAYAAADVVVVPSVLPEPFGLVAAEAMALARPVVAADHGGLAEIVEHGRTGRLVPPGDPRALADALEELLADPALAADLGRAGAERRKRLFTVERYAAELGALYRELAARRAPEEVAA